MAALVMCALCALVVLKPQEFMDALQGFPLVYCTFGALLAAVVRDLVWKRIRPALAPHLVFILAFFVWGIAVAFVKRNDRFQVQALQLSVVAAVMISVAVGGASSFGLRAFAVTWVGCATLVTTVAIVQGGRPFVCLVAEKDDWEGRGELAYDGRPCVTPYDCRANAPNPEVNFRCERPGPLQTATLGGRVRYRGSLSDPNELSLMISTAVPLLFGMAELRRANRAKRKEEIDAENDGPTETEADAEPVSEGERRSHLAALPPLMSDRFLLRVFGALKALPVAAVVAAIGYAVILSQSRSGLITFLVVVGLFFIRKVGVWGVVVGCVVAPPMLLLGGRSGAEADDSSNERAELLREGFEFIRNTRGFGLGVGGFPEESSIGLTAHNAYVLATAEAGVVGLYLFGFALYLGIKVPYAIWFGDYRLGPTTARFAPALAIALTGAAVGIFFLSWTYKDILYMLLGASAALYSAARVDDPRVHVGLGAREAVGVAAMISALMSVIYVVARIHKV